jgi:hypothetical protein
MRVIINSTLEGSAPSTEVFELVGGQAVFLVIK